MFAAGVVYISGYFGHTWMYKHRTRIKSRERHLDIILSVLAKYYLSVLMSLIVTDAGATGTFTCI